MSKVEMWLPIYDPRASTLFRTRKALLRKWAVPLAAVVLCIASARLYVAIIAPPNPVYKGKPLRYWIQRDVRRGDPDALLVVASVLAHQDASERVCTGREMRQCILTALKVKDSKWRKPYNALRGMMPAFVIGFLPEWQDPKEVRAAAATWVCSRAWTTAPLLPGSSNPEVTSRMISWAIASYGIVAPSDYQVMLPALTDPDPLGPEICPHVVGKAKLHPETVVPILVSGLQDDAMRSYYAATLQAYGSQARFATPSLLLLASTNDPATASSAAWVLANISSNGIPAGDSVRTTTTFGF